MPRGLRLRRLMPPDRVAARKLVVHPWQNHPSAAEMLDQLAATEQAFAIWMGDAIVGLLTFERDYGEKFAFARPGEVGLCALMIDGAHQGRGIGKRVMARLQGLTRDVFPRAPALVLTLDPSNSVAKHLFQSAGFQIEKVAVLVPGQGPQEILRLDLIR